MRDTFLLQIDFTLNPEKRRELNSSLSSLTWKEGAGHVRTSVYEDRDDRDRCLLVTEWSDKKSLDRCFASDTYSALLGCLLTLGRISGCRLVSPNSAIPWGLIPPEVSSEAQD